MKPQELIKRHLNDIQKPSRYIGGEFGSVVKDASAVDIRYAFCFPDLYDIGMSHLGMKILYHLLNERQDTWCERVFAPDTDMEALMRRYSMPLYGLESKDPIRDFDFIGFTLQYELCYTNILNMLDLAGVPLLSEERDDSYPVVMCGGPCACNPSALADYVDLFFIGDGEEYFPVLLDLYKSCAGKSEFLRRASQISCMYVPKYHDPNKKVVRAMVEDLDRMYYPSQFVVPFTETVHDRAMIEVMRGCTRGCRFCQAGMIYRPYRQKSPKRLLDCAVRLCENTGYDEISLSSLSTSDYEGLAELTDDLLDYCVPQSISISMPSLRVDNFTKNILDKISAVRKSGLTFAPEAGTQRLRDVINKNVTDADIENTCRIAFEGGASAVKLYFMMGLPTETDEDLAGIVNIANHIEDLYYNINGPKARKLKINISLATFVPKPFTPFQWEAQITVEEAKRKQDYLMSLPHSANIRIHCSDGRTSRIEGVMSRADKKIGKALYEAWKLGCKFDAWDEHFDYDKWMEAFRRANICADDYASRTRSEDEHLPWDIIDVGISKEFLLRERRLAFKAQTTPDCRRKCAGCGINKYCKGDVCP